MPSGHTKLLFMHRKTVVPFRGSVRFVKRRPLSALVIGMFPGSISSCAVCRSSNGACSCRGKTVTAAHFRYGRDRQVMRFAIFPIRKSCGNVYGTQACRLRVSTPRHPSRILMGGIPVVS